MIWIGKYDTRKYFENTYRESSSSEITRNLVGNNNTAVNESVRTIFLIEY